MSKELTEQFWNGTLPAGDYYLKHTDGRILIYWFNGVEFRFIYNVFIKEVLAPVPTYDHFVGLTKKVEELEWRIEELEQQNAFECECNKEYADTLEKNEQLESEVNEWKEKYFALLDNDI